jgi:RluA family pseudouridine synthase
MSAPIPLIYEAGPCFVLDKPAGLATQAPPEFDSLELRLKDWLREREGKTGNIYLGVPHRLDRPVSGAIVFARHVRAARRLSEQFENRQVRKTYWACVSGTVEPEAGTWRDWLRKIYGKPRTEIVGEHDADARLAVLHYRTLARLPWGSWLEIELETGRTHQVRIQAAARGHHVLGDAFYGSSVPFGTQHDDERLRAIALHARSLAFKHPMTREPVEVVAPLSDSWRALELPLGDAEFAGKRPD